MNTSTYFYRIIPSPKNVITTPILSCISFINFLWILQISIKWMNLFSSAVWSNFPLFLLSGKNNGTDIISAFLVVFSMRSITVWEILWFPASTEGSFLTNIFNIHQIDHFRFIHANLVVQTLINYFSTANSSSGCSWTKGKICCINGSSSQSGRWN